MAGTTNILGSCGGAGRLAGQCTSNEAYMAANCARSCKKCVPRVDGVSGECADLAPNCAPLVDAGYIVMAYIVMASRRTALRSSMQVI